MQTNEAVGQQSIQQAVIEKLALLSLEQQKAVLAFAEEIAQAEAKPSKFRALFERAAQDVPPEAWDEVPADASSNIDATLRATWGNENRLRRYALVGLRSQSALSMASRGTGRRVGAWRS